MSDFWNIKKVRARKEHKCDICNQIISKGIKCVYEYGKFCGDFNSLYLCNQCYELKEHYCHENREDVRMDGWIGEDVIYDIRENVCYDCDKHDRCQYKYGDCVVCPTAISLYMNYKKEALV
jgi:hypothetical protein